MVTTQQYQSAVFQYHAQVKLTGKFMRKVPEAIRKELAILGSSMKKVSSHVFLHLGCNMTVQSCDIGLW